VTLAARNVPVPVHHSYAETGDGENDPDDQNRGDDVLTAVIGEYAQQSGDPRTDPGTRQQPLVPTRRDRPRKWGATLWASAKLGFDPLVDLCANPIDQALGYSIVIGAELPQSVPAARLIIEVSVSS
jgi:hypothetical protein